MSPAVEIAVEIEVKASPALSPRAELRVDDRVPQKLLSIKESAASKIMNSRYLSSVRRPSLWRAIEAVTIAGVFCCVVLSASIHRLSAFSAEASGPAAVTENLASAQTERSRLSVLYGNTGLEILRSTERAEADIVAQDTIVRYDRHTGSRQGRSLAKSYAVTASTVSAKDSIASATIRSHARG